MVFKVAVNSVILRNLGRDFPMYMVNWHRMLLPIKAPQIA